MARIKGTDQGDDLNGTEDDDLITGKFRNDTIRAGAGDDTVEGGKGRNTMDGGEGFDFVSYKNAPIGIQAVVADAEFNGARRGTNLGADITDNFEGAIGSDFDDFLQGFGDDANYLRGRGGDDLLVGDDGPDTLAGGRGDDTYGVLREATDADGDVVTFFSRKDLFDFRRSGESPEFKRFKFVDDAEFSGRAGELRAGANPDQPGGFLVQGDIDGDGAADFTLTVERAREVITREDFLL